METAEFPLETYTNLKLTKGHIRRVLKGRDSLEYSNLNLHHGALEFIDLLISLKGKNLPVYTFRVYNVQSYFTR
jgi:hypothetical protein